MPPFECLVAWPLLCLALIGIGGAARRWMGEAGPGPDAWGRDGWIGWALVVVFLQLWHLFLPVNDPALVLVLLVGLALLARAVLRTRPRISWPAAVTGILLFVWLGSGWTLRAIAYDTGLYHLGALRWANEQPIVPGLGLLHDRFAFNNSSFLWLALCDYGAGTFGRAAAGVEILFFFSMMRAVNGVRRVAGLRREPRPRELFDAVSLVPLLVVAMEDFRYDGPLSPDLLLFPLGLMVVSELVGYLDRGEDGRAWVVLLFAACAVTVKLSFTGAALAAWLVVLARDYRNRRLWLEAMVLAVAVGAIWSVRAVILSGWPVFPATVAGVPVPWRIPAAEAAAHRDVIRAWAWVSPAGPVRPAAWLRHMLSQRFAVVVPLLLAAAASIVGLVRRRRDRRWLAAGPGAAGLAFWMLTAPSARFAGSLPWALALATVSVAVAGWPARRVRRITLVLLAVLGAWFVNPWMYVANLRHGWPEIPAADLVSRVTRSGLEVLVPLEGDQCWDAPLPHAPRLDPRLAARAPGRLGAGFVRIEAAD